MTKELGAPKTNVSLDKTTAVTCESCGHNIFQEGYMLRKVSKFLIGTNQDGIIPMPAVSCIKCGTVVQEMLDPQLRTPKD
jgi:DNA-directed RNA polymerase subunit RPC12/RpoP